MFNYSKNTEVNMLFKVNELLRTIQADKATKADSANISLIKLTNTLSAENTKLEARPCRSFPASHKRAGG